jgi:hypothetical protein
MAEEGQRRRDEDCPTLREPTTVDGLQGLRQLFRLGSPMKTWAQ